MVHRRNRPLAAFTLMILLTCFPYSVHATPVEEIKVKLQSDLQRHIYGSLVDGAYHTLDSETGQVRQLYPLTSHPLILQMGTYYVMCADFRDIDGNNVDVDFYLLKKPKGYQVFGAEIDNRTLVEGLMDEGKAKVFN